MRTVRDDEGRTYLLVKESGESSLVRDPETGEERYVDNADLEPVAGESLPTAATAGIPEPVRRAIAACPDDRALGLLVTLADDGPVPVVDLLETTDLCESDLLGRATELRMAGLVDEVDAGGSRGYDATDLGREAVELLRRTE